MKTNVIKTIIFFLITASGAFHLSGCSNPNLEKFKNQLQIVDMLVNFFESGDSLSVKKMMGIELSYIGMDDESLDYSIEKFHSYLEKYKISSKEDFEFKEYPKKNPRLVDITIPFIDKATKKKSI